jgi:hypothetical protein
MPKKYKEIKVETVAKAMVADAEHQLTSLDPNKSIVHSYPNDKLFDLAK